MKIGIIGCSGRMGKALIEAVYFSEDATLSGGTVRPDSTFAGVDLGTLAGIEPISINTTSHIETLIKESDAVIDFTSPDLSLNVAEHAAAHKVAHICGTTGFSDAEKEKLAEFAKQTPIVWAANMSVGVNLLQMLVQQVASVLNEDYDIEVLEMHHCRKVDAPSGTALMLGEAAAKGRKVPLGDVARKSREGIIGPRPRGEIGFATLRGGDVVGEHTVMFAGDSERIELTHKASDRKIFAKGALRAALWSKGKAPELYSMIDVLDIPKLG